MRAGLAVSAALILGSVTAEAVTADEVLRETGFQGGLIVHVGCRDGRLTAGLVRDGAVVFGLDAERANVEAARARFVREGVNGRGTAELLRRGGIPLVDGTAALVVVEDSASVPMPEVMRVLAPGGVSYVRSRGRWRKTVKPRPENIDAWTHYLHGPGNNAVAADSVIDRPFHFRWTGGPVWQRSHDFLASMSALVADERRLYYIFDEGETSSMAFPPKWTLAARDAFSGIVLWKRPIDEWENYLVHFRSGPVHLPRALVVGGGRVYAILGYDRPVTALDPATGKTLKTYEGTAGAREILFDDGRLTLVIHEKRDGAHVAFDPKGEPPSKRIAVLDAATGRTLWKKSAAEARGLVSGTMGTSGGFTVYQKGGTLVCVDAATGRELWTAEGRGPDSYRPWTHPTTVIVGNTVLWGDYSRKRGRNNEGSGTIVAFDAATGRELWRADAWDSFRAPIEVFVIKGLVWTRERKTAKDHGRAVARDLRTGEVTRRLEPDAKLFSIGGHAWCYRNKATERFLLRGQAGVDFLSVDGDGGSAHHFVRGTCQYGIMPANGLVYAPPHSCACFIKAKLNGFVALAPRAGSPVYERKEPRLEKGPAFAGLARGWPGAKASAGEWPTFRADAARGASLPSGATRAPRSLRKKWEARIPGRLSAPVFAGGRLYVASVDAHTVHALGREGGKRLWTFTAGGRVDTPPSVHRGLVLFGSADGWVYCLRASDGKLAWRFRASGADVRMVAHGQVESVWPVPGSVLVLGDHAYFASGRTSYLDGGMRLHKLDIRSGALVAERKLYDRDPETGVVPRGYARGKSIAPAALPDVLSSDGESIFLRHRRFDLDLAPVAEDAPHVFSSVGFVDDSWWQRTYQLYGPTMQGGFGVWFRQGNRAPAGRLIALRGDTVFGFGRTTPYDCFDNFAGLNLKRYHIFSAPAAARVKRGEFDTVDWGKRIVKRKGEVIGYNWTRDTGVRARALAVAGDRVFLAGPRNVLHGIEPKEIKRARALVREHAEEFAGRKGGILWAVSTKDGRKVGEVELESPPVHQGLIAAGGALYMTTVDGRVVCLGD
jgi:outer membrane protein assembly factor BamB